MNTSRARTSSARRPQRPRMRTRSSVVAAFAVVFILAVGAGVVFASGGPFANYPPGKAALLQQEQNAIATAQANAPKKPNAANYAPPVSVAATPAAGIVSLRQGPFPACQFTVNNFWQGPVNGQWYLVYAGSRNTDMTTCGGGHGALTIYSEQIGQYGAGPTATVGTFTAPSGVTTLTITAASGSTLTLRTNTGATLTFNLATKTFS